MATDGPTIIMNMATTEHDFRFPRRPELGLNQHRKPRIARNTESLEQLQSRLGQIHSRASNEIRENSVFPALKNNQVTPTNSLDIESPGHQLLAQVWRFFKDSKQSLPNADRMENMTWRIMSMDLIRGAQDQKGDEEK